MKKNVIFRVDGGNDAGLGHLIRSLSLCKLLSKRQTDINIYFIGKSNPYIHQKLKKENVPFIALKELDEFEDLMSWTLKLKPSFIFIDTNYSYSLQQIASLNKVSKVVLFNNLYEGAFASYCTIIPNAHRKDEELQLYSPIPKLYNGIDYVLINDKILTYERKTKCIEKGQIGITTGGSDPANVLLRLLHILQDPRLLGNKIVAFYGENYMHKDELFEFINHYKGKNILAVPYEFNRLISSEVVICTFGVSTYELLYCGKPIISVGHSQFNTEAASILNKKYNCFVDWGYAQELKPNMCVNSILNLLDSQELLQYYSTRGWELIDGKGLHRITDILVNILDEDDN